VLIRKRFFPDGFACRKGISAPGQLRFLLTGSAFFLNTANWRGVINKTRKYVTIAHCAIIKVDLLRASLPRRAWKIEALLINV
jgi:hypothetical protein